MAIMNARNWYYETAECKDSSIALKEPLTPLFIDSEGNLHYSIPKGSPRKGFRYCQNIDKDEEKYCTEAFKMLHLEKGTDFFFTDNATSIYGHPLKDLLELHVNINIKAETLSKMWKAKRALIEIAEEDDNDR